MTYKANYVNNPSPVIVCGTMFSTTLTYPAVRGFLVN